ncbi:MAG: energy-coupling factor transporter transmembrane protein EcfT [Cohaesibacter sp.]|jgi:biotin transport system permease protein|nr:energy-coupling factor transporter transmembrane protein EcfT [Cohaesibacter sp.]
MLSLSVPGKSWLHRLPASFKLLALCISSMGLFALQSWELALVATAIVGLLYASLGRSFAMLGLSRLKPLIWMFVVILAYHVITNRIEDGIVISLRLAAAVGLATLVTMTTRLDAMMEIAEWLATPLYKLGMPRRTLGLAFAMVLRFTPVFIQKGQILAEAWRARSPKRTSSRLLVPLSLTALDDAERVAEALKARGGLTKPEKREA